MQRKDADLRVICLLIWHHVRELRAPPSAAFFMQRKTEGLKCASQRGVIKLKPKLTKS